MYKLAVIFLIGMTGIWKAIPAGFLLKVQPLLVFFMTVFGAATSVTIICFLGNRIKMRLARKKGKHIQRKMSKGGLLLQKYGVVGLGIFGTVMLGPNFTTIVGLILVNKHKRLMLWVLVGVFFWSGVLTISAFLGLSVFSDLLPKRFFHGPPA
jgi:uncharacterized membrane protein